MRKRLFLLIFICLFFLGCNNSDFRRLESDIYCIDYSVIVDNKYCINNKEFIMPQLPYGLFLYFDYFEDNNLFFPTLDYQGRYENVETYPIKGIKKILQDTKSIKIETVDGYFSINLNNIYEIEKINTLTGKMIYDFSEIDTKIVPKYIHDIYGLQDKNLLKKYHVNYATPKINGIVWIGLTPDKYYFGKTIYSYFYIKNEDIIFFYDETDFRDFLKKNNKDKSTILASKYIYDY